MLAQTVIFRPPSYTTHQPTPLWRLFLIKLSLSLSLSLPTYPTQPTNPSIRLHCPGCKTGTILGGIVPVLPPDKNRTHKDLTHVKIVTHKKIAKLLQL